MLGPGRRLRAVLAELVATSCFDRDGQSRRYTRIYSPKLNARLPDNMRLVNQIAWSERRTSRGGKDSIDHLPNGHNDLANAIAGVATHVVNQHNVTA